MLITFSINDDIVSVSVVTEIVCKSEYIKSLVQDVGDSTIVIPQQYTSIINNYISYLKGNQDDIIITDSLYFSMAMYFDDIKYSDYLFQQLFDHWSNAIKVKICAEFNDDLQWLIYLHCPYDFVPKSFVENVSFMKQWTQYNQNKIIKVNNSLTYYNNVTSVNPDGETVTKTYHVDSSDDNINNSNNSNNSSSSCKEIGYSKTIVYYPSGLQRCEYESTNNKKNGLWKEWYDNHQHCLKKQCNFIDDELSGLWKYWYETGRLKSEGDYVADKRVGVWSQWHNNDQHCLMKQGNLTDDKLNGLWRHWYESGRLKSEGDYVDNRRVGVWTQWHDNDQHCLMKQGGLSGNKLNGLWRYWYDSGRLQSEGNYLNSARVGLWTQWHNNDQHCLMKMGKFTDNELSGTWRYWYDSGRLESEGDYVANKRVGVWTQWYNSGNYSIMKEHYYVDDKKNGVFKWWYDDDQHSLKQVIHYVDDRKNGQQTEYDQAGNVTVDDNYIDDIIQQ
jgi:antitoxin component YwqK of YwqJK toxin-antitoxin module